MRKLFLPFLLTVSAWSQDTLTLPQAEDLAVKNHPQIKAALLAAAAANQVTVQARAADYPTFFGSVTAAGAIDNSRLAAGNLNNPIIYNRISTGITASQLISDFGRTSALVLSARQRAEAQQDTATATRAAILLQLDAAFYSALRAQNVLAVASETVKNRQVI